MTRRKKCALFFLYALLKNTSDIQPETLHAATRGQSIPVFGLAHLLGLQLMPRIRNWVVSQFS
jgi:TnpA family transposase